MTKYIRNRHFFLLDILLLSLATYGSFVLHAETVHLNDYSWLFLLFMGSAVPFTVLTFFCLGVYARFWRYASIDELLLLSTAVVIATTLTTLTTYFFSRLLPNLPSFPWPVPFVYFLLALMLTAVPRLLIRAYTRYQHNTNGSAHHKKVLIAGAGEAGLLIVRELQNNPQLGMTPIGFVDDDPAKHKLRIQGLTVLGNRHDIPTIVAKLNIKQVIIAMPTASGQTIRQFVEICEKARVKTKIMPGMYKLLDGTFTVNQLRNVEIEDLLQRPSVQTDTTAVSALIHNKRILITGGGGSIGSELCRQILRCQPAQLILVGHGENSIFEIYNELQLQRSNTHIIPLIADTRFPNRISAIFQQYQPQIVFHAAAHKHVPLMEKNPTEAITNNVSGTRNLLNASLQAQVEHFVMISTDKAVNPTSIMGASKRAAELLVHQAAQTSGRPYVAVRFGNVLGSRGSVILTFKKQIAAGGPVTITHPDVTRFFMTIPEAVQLVLQAAVLGHGGEIFVLDMGQPIKIADLARDLIELSGLKVGQDIDIVTTGLRPGEKLYEELFIPGEQYGRSQYEKIFVANNATTAIPSDLNQSIAILEAAANRNDERAVTRALHALIPEFSPPTAVAHPAHPPNITTTRADHQFPIPPPTLSPTRYSPHVR